MSDEIVPPNLSDDKKAEGMAAAGRSFTQPGVENALKIDIDAFTQNTKLLTELFADVHANLADFDKKNLAPPMAPTWNTYKEEYRRLLWNSRDLATEIATSAEQFSTSILPLAAAVEKYPPSDPALKPYIEEVVRTLDWYIDNNQANSEKAKKQADEFAALKANVSTFSDDFEEFGKDLEMKNKIRIEELKNNIETAKKALEEVNKKVLAAAIALGISILVTAALVFMPGVGWAAVGVGVAAAVGSAAALTVFELQAKELRERIVKDSTEKAELEDQNEQIIKIRQALQRLKTDKVEHIVAGLGTFEEIWNAVNSDCVSIKKYLQDVLNASGQPNPMPLILISYLKSANTLYIGLSKALRDYAVGIVNSGATPPHGY